MIIFARTNPDPRHTETKKTNHIEATTLKHTKATKPNHMEANNPHHTRNHHKTFYIVNISGPRTDPRGIPEKTLVASNITTPRVKSEMSKADISGASKCEWLMVSAAAVKMRTINDVNNLLPCCS